MTINISGAVSSVIFSREAISRSNVLHACCSCHEEILERKHKVIATLEFPTGALIGCRDKQFYFCHDCYQKLNVHKARQMSDIEGCISRFMIPELNCLKISDPVVSKAGLIIIKHETHSDISFATPGMGLPEQLYIYLGEKAGYMYFYHGEHNLVRVWPGSFLDAFHLPEVCKRRLASGYNQV